MKKIQIHDSCFCAQSSYGRKKVKEPEVIEFDAPDSLIVSRLTKYMDHCLSIGNCTSIHQIEALLELLTTADSFGHDINMMLLKATANGWRQVVYDNHLQPKVS